MTGFQLEVLPQRIDALKHLRYLKLDGNTKMERLPKSIFKLQNLQSLILSRVVEELPKDVRYLVSLRLLWLCTKQKRLPEGGIGCLGSPQILLIWLCENIEYLCEDMQGLKSLRKLQIIGCGSLKSLPRSMKYLTKLENLAIFYCTSLDLTMEEEEEEEFNQLSLQDVCFGFLPVTVALPKQLLQGSANSLQRLVILGCPNIRELPECVRNLTSLQLLSIDLSPMLEERCRREKGGDWPKIAHIPQILVDGVNIQKTSY